MSNPQRRLPLLSHGMDCGFEWEVMNCLAHRCGYVRIPKGHPWHGITDQLLQFGKWGDNGYIVKPAGIDVHGGLTFSDTDTSDSSWWVGFDCNHSFDMPDPELPGFQPSMLQFHSNNPKDICSQEYVESECQSLCKQAKQAQSKAHRKRYWNKNTLQELTFAT